MIRNALWRTRTPLHSLQPLCCQKAFAHKHGFDFKPAELSGIEPSPAQDGQVTPSNHVQSFARRANIGFPDGMKAMKTKTLGRNPTGLIIATSPQHVFHPWSMRYLDRTGHAYCEMTLKRYAAKKDPLWWFVMVNTGRELKTSTYVRSTMKRKVQHAFREALSRNGYDPAGRRLQHPGDAVANAGDPSIDTGDLYGSVKIEGAIKPLLTLKFGVMVDFFEKVVKKLETTLAGSSDKPNDGSHVVRENPGIKAPPKPRKPVARPAGFI